MPTKAMIVVAGGSSTRFGRDKLMTPIGGLPLVAHTVLAVAPHVHRCVLVCRKDHLETLAALGLPAEIVPGGPTRTTSELAGLAALDGEPDVIGIHDGARPMVSTRLIRRVFDTAAEVGGAVPMLVPPAALVTRNDLIPVGSAGVAQTPQAFKRSILLATYAKAADAEYEGQDTVDVVQRFSHQIIAAVAGDPDNIKVTFPEDVDLIRKRLEASSHT